MERQVLGLLLVALMGGCADDSGCGNAGAAGRGNTAGGTSCPGGQDTCGVGDSYFYFENCEAP